MANSTYEMKYTFHVISGKFTQSDIEAVLGVPQTYWGWGDITEDCPSCGLLQGVLRTAGWGDFMACCRIYIHADGICVRSGMEYLASDRTFSKKTYLKLKKGLKKVSA